MSLIYQELIGVAEKCYADFHTRIANTQKQVLGVRMPILRNMAKRLRFEDVKKEDMSIYENVMLLALTLARQDYSIFLKELDGVIEYFDSWAFVDCMASGLRCVKQNAQSAENDLAYLLEKSEFYKRTYIVLAMNYFPLSAYAQRRIAGVKTGEYYVDMAIAWYVSELMTLDFDFALRYLDCFSERIKRFAKRKGLDSFRLNEEQKLVLTHINYKN